MGAAMAYLNDGYRPNARNRAILEAAWQHVTSVPYAVTLRWLYYRIYQEGHYPDKRRGYNSFKDLLSRARHNGYGGWKPDTLADDTNSVVERGGGFDTPGAWLDAMKQRAECRLHRWEGQAYYAEVWIEARAMIRQFEYYTQGMKICPLGGQPSIPYKWELAQGIDAAADRYGLPIVILYFGDLDAGGEQIGQTVEDDVTRWAAAPFEFIRAALNPGDPERYSIPENPEAPGNYQWEAVDDPTAAAIIRKATAPFVDRERMQAVARLEADATRRFRESIGQLELA
jgi:hypothetical protein